MIDPEITKSREWKGGWQKRVGRGLCRECREWLGKRILSCKPGSNSDTMWPWVAF
jgi:hypothetical protein